MKIEDMTTAQLVTEAARLRRTLQDGAVTSNRAEAVRRHVAALDAELATRPQRLAG